MITAACQNTSIQEVSIGLLDTLRIFLKDSLAEPSLAKVPNALVCPSLASILHISFLCFEHVLDMDIPPIFYVEDVLTILLDHFVEMSSVNGSSFVYTHTSLCMFFIEQGVSS